MHLMRVRLILFTLLLLLPIEALASEYVMVFGGRYPPFYWMGKADGTEKSGRGMFIDFLDRFEANNPDTTIQKVCLPRKRMDEWLAMGKADAFSLNAEIFVTSENRRHMEFTTPLWRSGDHLMVPANSVIRDSSITSIRGKRIGLIHGNAYPSLDAAAEKGTIKTARAVSMRMLMEMLDRGRLDAVVVNRHTVHHYLSLLEFKASDYKILDPPLYEFDLSVAVHKNQPELLKMLNKFIEQSHNDGFLQQLEARWFDAEYIQDERLPEFAESPSPTQ
ncbi:substrate-binding periplasmic protein [Salidesulfovibrio brasiliensis]